MRGPSFPDASAWNREPLWGPSSGTWTHPGRLLQGSGSSDTGEWPNMVLSDMLEGQGWWQPQAWGEDLPSNSCRA